MSFSDFDLVFASFNTSLKSLRVIVSMKLIIGSSVPACQQRGCDQPEFIYQALRNRWSICKERWS